MKKQHAIFISIVIIFGGILVADVFGLWQPVSTKVPVLTSDGEYDPGDIRGSYTFGDIDRIFDIDPLYLTEAYGVKTETPETFAVKNLESLYSGLGTYYENDALEIGTGSIRYFVSLITGIESDLVSETYLPKQGVEMLIRDGYIQASDQAVMWAIDLSVTFEPIVEETHSEPIVKGNTTIQDLINLGFTQEILANFLSNAQFERVDLIKDICVENGLSFSEVKTEMATYYEQNLLN